MKTTKLWVAVLIALIYFPLSFFLQFKILETINASELMWFIFILQVPVLITQAIISKLAEREVISSLVDDIKKLIERD